MTELPRLLRRRQVCEELGISSRQVSKFVKGGALHPFKVKGMKKVWYRREEVLKLGEATGK